MGSTIVLLIEGRGVVEWKCGAGEKIKYGDILCEMEK